MAYLKLMIFLFSLLTLVSRFATAIKAFRIAK